MEEELTVHSNESLLRIESLSTMIVIMIMLMIIIIIIIKEMVGLGG